MPSIAFFTAHRAFPWVRQLPPDLAPAAGWRVTMQREDADCRLLVVYDEPSPGLVTHVPRENRLVVLSEPPGIKSYRAGYLDQFGHVLGPIEPVGSSARWIRAQPALPWFFGIGFAKEGLLANLSLDDLAKGSPPEKRAELSVVLSAKSQLPKHKARLAFVDALKTRLGDRLHVFGRGFQEIGDKAEAILPYAYHLVLENNDIPHFWTEKTADACLGWALPLFSGCANIGDYFPAGSFEPVDIRQGAEAIDRIVRLLDENPYAARLPALAEARARLLGPHALGSRLAEIALEISRDVPQLKHPEILRLNREFGLARFLRPLRKLAGR